MTTCVSSKASETSSRGRGPRPEEPSRVSKRPVRSAVVSTVPVTFVAGSPPTTGPARTDPHRPALLDDGHLRESRDVVGTHRNERRAVTPLIAATAHDEAEVA